ncbi:RNA polymerase sigma factor [Occallatibacter riparius]|uniref:RNA polymerase sigma factor n=1 Tax=Occallatibacter riparius TaxID=1002689 RepID=A0A9J7BJI5_9BACT|nr:RNA polymerase sigma factor [Occallatibacter riparius]UWZ82839.1 RNA polymerase sigma factor [Occallatibacter riparius]
MSRLNELALGNQIPSTLGQAAEEFAAVASTCRPYVFRFLLASLRDADLAETLTQECLLKAHFHWSSFRGASNPRTWLIRIAENLQKDHWRNRRLQFWRQMTRSSVELDDVSNWLPTCERSPEDQASAREHVRLIWRIADDLPERQRTVFLLRFVEDLKIGEIAEIAGLNVGTVKAHLHRALCRIRAELEMMSRR